MREDADLRLLPWTRWDNDPMAWQETIVPRIEVGHEGPLPLAIVDLLLLVAVDPNDVPDPTVEILRAGRSMIRRRP